MRSIKALICTVVFSLLACSGGDDFRLFVYPNKDDLTVHREFGPYESVKEARTQARNQMAKYTDGDYEIGKNCKKNAGSSLWVCDETFR